MAHDIIVSDPGVMMGKPVIAGTRLTVEWVLARLGAGESVEQLVEQHPRLTREGVLAALSFAAQAFTEETIYPLSEVAL